MCFYKREQPALVVLILNFFVILCAASVIYLAFRFKQSELFQTSGTIAGYTQSSFYLFLSFGVVCLIATIIGFTAVKVKNRGVAIFYGVLLFPVALVFIIGGISLMAVTYATEEILGDICDGQNSNESEVVDLLMQYQQDIDLVISPIVDENMCRS
jgi:ABC-type sulfate transport system permease component